MTETSGQGINRNRDYLQAVYYDTLRAAQVPVPTFETDDSGHLVKQFEPEACAIFWDYFTYLKSKTNHFNEIHQSYFEGNRAKNVPISARADAVWMLASIAAGEERVASSAGLKGCLAQDVRHIGIVWDYPRNRTSIIGPNLVALVDRKLLDKLPDSEEMYTATNGDVTYRSRYRIADGPGPKEKVRVPERTKEWKRRSQRWGVAPA